MDFSWMNEMTQQLPAGAFLMVDGNPMTIGWAQYGVLWSRPCLTVYVRESRNTHRLLENATTFTVSVPELGAMRKELAYCGTKSSRDVDKVAELGLGLSPARFAAQDGLKGCKTHIECRILHRSVLKEALIEDPAIRDRYYRDGDEHTMFIGEILGVTSEEA